MKFIDYEIDAFLRALTNCVENPCVSTKFELQRRAISLRHTIREETKQMEETITNNVLKAISIKLEDNGVIDKIDSLKDAIDRLGKSNK